MGSLTCNKDLFIALKFDLSVPINLPYRYLKNSKLLQRIILSPLDAS